MLEELDQKGREAGLTINKDKTKILSQNTKEDGIAVKGEKNRSSNRVNLSGTINHMGK